MFASRAADGLREATKEIPVALRGRWKEACMSRRRKTPREPSGDFYYSDLTENPLYGLCGEESCISNEEATPEEIWESILEICSMLDYAVERGDKNEIASWRRMLAAAKIDLRKAKLTLNNA